VVVVVAAAVVVVVASVDKVVVREVVQVGKVAPLANLVMEGILWVVHSQQRLQQK